MAVEDRVRFGDLDVPKRITRSKTHLLVEDFRGNCADPFFTFHLIDKQLNEIRGQQRVGIEQKSVIGMLM